jgi:hypothetical protein
MSLHHSMVQLRCAAWHLWRALALEAAFAPSAC